VHPLPSIPTALKCTPDPWSLALQLLHYATPGAPFRPEAAPLASSSSPPFNHSVFLQVLLGTFTQ